MLFALSGVFLLLVIINGLFKFYINTYKGRLGERMLRRIRFELVDRVLRFPPSVFKRVKASEVATMVKDEVEPLGGFIGDAFVQPALLGGQALTALVFIVLQNFWLGLDRRGDRRACRRVIIPRMRRRLIRLGRERQLTARELSGRVGEIVDGIGTIHIHDTSNYERADIAARLGRIFKIRYDLYQWKFLVKFLNNFLAAGDAVPVLSDRRLSGAQGQLDIGQLVAVIAAYKDLPGPLKDLIDWDQARQDVQVKYAQVVEQFTVDTTDRPAHPGRRPRTASSRSPSRSRRSTCRSSTTAARRLLERVSLQIQAGRDRRHRRHGGSGAEALAEAFARLIWPESGKVAVGDRDLLELPEVDHRPPHLLCLVRRLSFPGHARRQPALRAEACAAAGRRSYEEAKAAKRKWEIDEARKAGNPDFDIMQRLDRL